jgi:ABC-type phosphate transport system substrate-binding protein
MRQTTWANEEPITVFVLIDKHKTHQTFSTNVLGLFPYQLERVWNKLVYSGLGEEPIKVNSEQEMLKKVSNNPGSIGYLELRPKHDNVKVLSVVKEQIE